MVLNGYVKIHRKLVQWGWYQDNAVKSVFLHLLIVAAFKPGHYMGHEIKPGQAVVGTQKLSTDLGLSRQQVRTALKKLESTGEISQNSTNKFTIITVENWGDYQSSEDFVTNEQPTINQRATNHQPTNNQRITNHQPHLKKVKKDKNVKNVKNERNIYSEFFSDLPSELKKPMEDFIEMRESIKKPLTANAANLIVKKANKLSGGSLRETAEIIEQSVMNCWQGVFPLKKDSSQERKTVAELVQEGVFDD